MKPKTKKTLIIVAAVAIVAAIVYFAFFRKSNKNSTAAIISGLNVDLGVKSLLSNMVSYINTGWDDEHKAQIAANAEAKGRTLAQQTVAEAAYALWESGQIDNATYSSIVAQL